MSKMPADRTAGWSRIFDRYSRPASPLLNQDNAKAEKPLPEGNDRLGARVGIGAQPPQKVRPVPR